MGHLNSRAKMAYRETMRQISLAATLTLTLSLLVSACGGSTPPPDTAADAKKTDAAAETKADSDKAAPDKANTSSDTKSSDTKKEDSSSSSGPAIVRTAQSRLTTPDVVFMFSFNESDVKAKAEKDCADKTKGDAEKNGACMAAARKRVEADGYHFMKGDDGQWYWLVIRQKGKVLTYLHRVPIEFIKDSATSVVLKPVGKDKGSTPFKTLPSEITIETPNDYQIVENDPQMGKVVYEAKMGLLNAENAKR
jgi:hypothetical protein